MQRFQRTITWGLLIFIAAAIVTTFRPRETIFLPDGLCVLFWHSETRCPPCLKMEELILQVLDDQKGYRLCNLKYDVLAHQLLAQEFNVGTATIILVERKDQKNIRIRDLTARVWQNITDDFAFVTMLRQELEQFANTGESQSRK